jgi:hypothetical protein
MIKRLSIPVKTGILTIDLKMDSHFRGNDNSNNTEQEQKNVLLFVLKLNFAGKQFV